MQLPKIHSYVGQVGKAMTITVGPITVWFSYQTPIAFRFLGKDIVVRQNDWKQTTGKHLNRIDGGNKEDRLTSAKFEEIWTEQVAPLFNANF